MALLMYLKLVLQPHTKNYITIHINTHTFYIVGDCLHRQLYFFNYHVLVLFSVNF